MLHISTRGDAPKLSFIDALLAGLARDGGLYVPVSWPQLSHATIAGFAGLPYTKVAQSVLGALIDGEIAESELSAMIGQAYGAFRHPAVCPLVQIGDNLFVLELFHGPTLAFKDVAMRLLARLMDHVLRARGQRATIVGATSGDTGSAAIDAFSGLDQVDVIILYPHGRVSEVQRRQMTTMDAPNVHALAVEGTFDDCQALVKGMFNHHAFRDEMALSGANCCANDILFHSCRKSWRTSAPYIVCSTHRQFRRCSGWLCRQADGPAYGPAGHWHKCQRYPGAHAQSGSV
jgi:threonine synthase